MTPVLVLTAALVTAVAAAVRSTWSPCGLSMLSAITPLGERGRHRRYRHTAAWFIVGGTLGGFTSGALLAVGAAATGALGPEPAGAGGLAAVAALVCVAFETGLLRPALPHHRRQVNELWLHRYRGWATGTGFGWQIGTGFATYLMTAAVYLAAVLAVLSGRPLVALAAGTLFGLVRGLAILLVAGVTDPARLARFHRIFDDAREPVRLATVAVEVAVAAVAAAVTWGAAAGIGVLAVVGAVAARRATRSPVPAERRPLIVR